MRAIKSILMGLAIAYLILFALANNPFAPSAAIATPMPAIGWIGEDGVRRKLVAGKPVIVHFWAMWCAPCVAELPALAAYAAAHPERQIIALAQDGQDMAKLRQFLNAHQAANLAPNHDAGGQALSAIRGRGIPTTLWVNEQLIITRRHEGPLNWAKE